MEEKTLTKEQEHLVHTLVDSFGTGELLRLMKTKQVGAAIETLSVKQKVSLFGALIPLLNEQQLGELLNRPSAKSRKIKAKSDSQD